MRASIYVLNIQLFNNSNRVLGLLACLTAITTSQLTINEKLPRTLIRALWNAFSPHKKTHFLWISFFPIQISVFISEICFKPQFCDLLFFLNFFTKHRNHRVLYYVAFPPHMFRYKIMVQSFCRIFVFKSEIRFTSHAKTYIFNIYASNTF